MSLTTCKLDNLISINLDMRAVSRRGMMKCEGGKGVAQIATDNGQ